MMVPEIEIVPQKLAEAKTVVLKTRLDSNVARLQAEGLKRNFFAKLVFFKPKIEEIQLIGYEKYYEPYIVIGGKYSLDYCKKHVFPIKVEKATRGVFIDGKKYEPAASKLGINLDQMIRLEGEEHVHYERETFFVLDRLRREISPESFSFAPYEVQPEGVTNLNLRKTRISGNEIIDMLRSKIARRPTDLAKIIREIFEINENTIVYRPFFEFTFHNTKTKDYVTLKIDGVSGDKVLYKYDNRNTRMICANPRLDSAYFTTTEAKLVSDNSKQQIDNRSSNLSENIFPESHQISEFQLHEAATSSGNVTLRFPANVSGEVFVVGDNVTAVVGDLEIPSGATIKDTLVVKGKLKIGDNCKFSGRVKVLGDVIIGINTVIDGDVISGGNVAIGSHSVIGGCIKAAGTIEFSEKVRVGKGLKRIPDRREESFDLEMIVESEKKEALV